MDYSTFLKSKSPASEQHGFAPLWMPSFLHPFQSMLTEWSIRLGRAALFEDCGLGKTPQQLVWAENVVRKTNGNVLILTPLAVAPQTIREANKFGIEAKQSRQGEVYKGLTVTNYHRLHHYNPDSFEGVVVDESGILKGFDRQTRKAVTAFLSKVNYRLLCTATPAPNDFMELGSSSEALGVMGRNQMLGMFFTNDGESTQQWRLKGHAKVRFWQWMASWARAVRKPSDLGFEDGDFKLPKLNTIIHTVPTNRRDGFFAWSAKTLNEQRREKRETLERRCEKVAEVLPKTRPCLVYCQLNDEGNLLARLIPGAVQVAGSDPDDVKEERLNAFGLGQIRALVTKSSIAGYGLNWQHCADMGVFVDHSHERFYQSIRRTYRFGQKRQVNCNIVCSEAENLVLENMLRKERLAVELYAGIVRHINDSVKVLSKNEQADRKVKVPKWLKTLKGEN